VSIETGQSNLDCSVLESLGDKTILLGVLDLSSNEVESVGVIKERVRRALAHVQPGRIVLAPDCGMKYLTREAAFGKLTAMTRAAAELRRELG
jgi:5-methyltetrahydropteroyltriglutamate--homocysteine methyltransferase